MTICIQRLSTVTNLSGRSKSSLYKDIQLELFPKPVSLGPRAVGWPEHEVQTVIAARVAGKDDEEIRAIVAALEATRLNFAFDKADDDHPASSAERSKNNPSGNEIKQIALTPEASRNNFTVDKPHEDHPIFSAGRSKSNSNGSEE